MRADMLSESDQRQRAKEEAERRWQLKEDAKRQQAKDAALKHQRAAQEAARRQKEVARQRQAKEEFAAKQRQAREDAARQRRREEGAEEEEHAQDEAAAQQASAQAPSFNSSLIRSAEVRPRGEGDRHPKAEAPSFNSSLIRSAEVRPQDEGVDLRPPAPSSQARSPHLIFEEIQRGMRRRPQEVAATQPRADVEEVVDVEYGHGNAAIAPEEEGWHARNGADEGPGGASAAASAGPLTAVQELLTSIDNEASRQDFIDIGRIRDGGDDDLEALVPKFAMIEKPEEDVARAEARREWLSARAAATREARDKAAKDMLRSVHLSALGQQFRQRAAPGPAAGQQKAKAAVRMPRRIKIGAAASSYEEFYPEEMPGASWEAPDAASRSAPSSAPPPSAQRSSDRAAGERLRDVPQPLAPEADLVQPRHVQAREAVEVPTEPPLPPPLTQQQLEAISDLDNGRTELSDLDEELRAHREVVLAAVRFDGSALKHAAPGLQDDREVALAAVYDNGLALKYAGRAVQRDRETVLAAVLESGAALEFASQDLRGNHEVVLTAIQQDPAAIRFATKKLLDSREFILAAAQTASSTAKFASDRLKRDREVVLAMAQHSADAFIHAAPELRGDHDFVLAVVQLNGLAIAHASAELKQDRAIVAAAIQNNPLAVAAARD